MALARVREGADGHRRANADKAVQAEEPANSCSIVTTVLEPQCYVRAKRTKSAETQEKGSACKDDDLTSCAHRSRMGWKPVLHEFRWRVKKASVDEEDLGQTRTAFLFNLIVGFTL